MKVSIILPVCDVPLGSKRPHYWLRKCIQSVIDGGHEDFELLVGCDGHIEQIHDVVDSFLDKRVIYVPCEETHSWGNHQCMRLQRDWARGDYIMWLNHDDSYAPGAVATAVEEAEAFPGRPIFFRAQIQCGVLVWTKPERPKDDASMVMQHVLATMTPNVPTTPLYPDFRRRDEKADLVWVSRVYDAFEAAGKPVVWSKEVILLVRPWAPPEPMPGKEFSIGGAMEFS